MNDAGMFVRLLLQRIGIQRPSFRFHHVDCSHFESKIHCIAAQLFVSRPEPNYVVARLQQGSGHQCIGFTGADCHKHIIGSGSFVQTGNLFSQALQAIYLRVVHSRGK